MSQLKLGALLQYVIIALNILVGVLYTPFMLKMLGQQEYGLYSLAFSVIGYLTVLDFGLGNAIVRYTAKFRAEGKIEEQYEMFGMFFRLYLLIGLVTFLIGIGLTLNIETLFSQTMSNEELNRMRIMMALMSFNLAITLPFSIYGSIITAYENFLFLRVVNLLRAILNPLIMILLLIAGYKAVAMVVVTTLFNISTLMLNWWFCYFRLRVKFLYKKFDFSFLREVSIYSLWIFLNAVMDQIYWSTGQFILGIYQGAAAVAVYALAIQLKVMYFMFSYAISGVFLPKVTKMVAQHSSNEEISDLFIRTGRLQYIVMSLILSGFIVMGKPFIRIWAGEDYDGAYLITVIIFVSTIVPLIQNLGILILQARNQMKFRSIIYLILSIVSGLIAIPMAKHYGGLGCALATGIGMVVGPTIIINIYYSRIIHLDILGFWREIGKMSIVPIMMVAVGCVLMQYISIVSIGEFIVYACAYVLVFAPLFWVFSMNQYEKDLFSKPLVTVFKRLRIV